MTSRKHFLPFVALVAFSSLGMLTMGSAPAGAATSLAGSGSSFAGIEFNQWTADVTHPPYGLDVNYQSSSSGNGRQQFKDKTVDFAVTDIRYDPPYDTTPPDPSTFHYVPVTAGGIAFMYNLKAHGFTASSKPINLSPQTVCGIFTGAVHYWDDSHIADLNKGVKLPHVQVYPIMRSDPAGTNFVMEEYCLKLQPTVYSSWAQYVITHGGGNFPTNTPTSSWPIYAPVNAATGSEGAANLVAGSNNDGYITAVETGYATQRGFPVASVENSNGKFVQPTDINVTTALSYAQQLADGTHVLDFNPPSDTAYNPSTYSYLLAPVKGIDPGKGKALSQFAEYCLTIGQQEASQLKYASIGRTLILYGLNRLKDIPGYVPPTAAELAAIPAQDVVKQQHPTGGGTTPTTPTSSSSGGSTTDTSGGAVSSAGTGTPTLTGSASSGGGSSGGGSGSGGSGSASLDPSASLTPGVGPLGHTGAEDGLLAIGAVAVLIPAELGRRRVLRRSRR